MKVQIKTWDRMVDEYGVSETGNIQCRYGFTRNMEGLLPEDRIIDIIKYENVDGIYYIWKCGNSNTYITEDMIEKKLLEDLPEELYIPNEEPAESLEVFKEDIFAINLEVVDAMARKNSHCHYLKWKLTDNLSVRYFYNFEDRPEMNGKFAIKNHKQRELIEISKDTAKEMICSFCTTYFEEIIGYNVKKVGYRKYIKSFGGKFEEFLNI